MFEEFSNFSVNFQEEGKEYLGEGDQFHNPVSQGLVGLEQIFEKHDRRKNNTDQMKPGDYIEVNLGS